MSAENTPDYQRGYRAAQADMRRDLANILRIQAEEDEDAETLSAAQVHAIFAGVFGVMAADEEFGEPVLDGK